jgi:hypothetical protein
MPNVVVSWSAQDAGARQPITLAPGQRLEIRLPSSDSWALSASDPGHILTAATPQGWYNRSAQACIWRFTAHGTGNVQLAFVGVAVCPYLEVCPSIELPVTYSITLR